MNLLPNKFMLISLNVLKLHSSSSFLLPNELQNIKSFEMERTGTQMGNIFSYFVRV